LPQQSPGEGEVLVQVQAAALTPTDTLLCTESASPLTELISVSHRPFVPGFFFCGKVLALGPFVEGLAVGEAVLGALDGSSLCHGAPVDSNGQRGSAQTHAGGCYRECACVHYSELLPAADLLAAGCHLPSVVAHLPPMIDALFCVAANLRLRATEALLIIAPRVADVIFLLQRLLFICDAWAGPLYLILLHGSVVSRTDLERHPLLRPLVSDQARHTFLESFSCFSVEEQAQKRFGTAAQPSQLVETLQDVVGQIVNGTRGIGVDVILAFDIDLAPPVSPPPAELYALPTTGGTGDPLSEPMPTRPPTLLRTLISALALRGRLITNCGHVEVMPADGEHLWIKEGSVSFMNTHCLLLSSARRGALLHAAVEVTGCIACSDLPVAESQVVQYKLFEQFQDALEARSASATPGAGAVKVPAAAAAAAGTFGATVTSQLVVLLL